LSPRNHEEEDSLEVKEETDEEGSRRVMKRNAIKTTIGVTLTAFCATPATAGPGIDSL
jgi:hypothetical protein